MNSPEIAPQIARGDSSVNDHVDATVSLRDVCGLWRRTQIAWPDGRTDADTEVFWLQGPRHYADLRVPAGRPACPGATCLRELDWPMLRFMARQEGFFGRLDVVASVGQWHRAFDYQPDTGIADRGALAFQDGILIERGIDLPYVEHWSRRSGAGDVLALSLAAEGEAVRGCLVVAGDAFIYARGREQALPRGINLTQLVDGAASLQAAQDLFDCEISFGRRHGGHWRVERSSHCFREGATLSPELDNAAGSVVIDDVSAEGARFKRTWRITEDESSIAAPLSNWFKLRARHDVPAPSEPARTMNTAPLGVPR